MERVWRVSGVPIRRAGIILQAANREIRRRGNWIVERRGKVFHPLPVVMQIGRRVCFRFKPLPITWGIGPALTRPTFVE